jgi:hypothetical protein
VTKEQQEWVDEYERYEQVYWNQQRGHEMRASDMIESKYMKQGDIDGDTIVTVQKIGKGNVAPEDQPPENKWMIRFKELPKPMVLNSTNIQALEKCLGEETDNWIGKEVILYVDPNVSYGGKVTGGLRIKSAAPAAAPKRVSTSMSDLEDDIPF